jgi:ABC-type antimicrobial peptide transport system permease subunit
VKSTPVLLALVLALLATMTLVHGLVSSVRRRRRELALLKTLGFTRRQVSGTVAWQASTVIGIAVVLGVPLGIVVGRWAWGTLVDELGAVAEAVVPWIVIAIGVPVLLLLANVVAFVPGRIAARLRPAAVLRSE